MQVQYASRLLVNGLAHQKCISNVHIRYAKWLAAFVWGVMAVLRATAFCSARSVYVLIWWSASLLINRDSCCTSLFVGHSWCASHLCELCYVVRLSCCVSFVVCWGLFDALSSVECRVLHNALCVALSVLCYVLSALLTCVSCVFYVQRVLWSLSIAYILSLFWSLAT